MFHTPVYGSEKFSYPSDFSVKFCTPSHCNPPQHPALNLASPLLTDISDKCILISFNNLIQNRTTGWENYFKCNIF